MSKQWIKGRPNRERRHDCEKHLPDFVPNGVEQNDKFVCPKCRRRWNLAFKHPMTDELLFRPHYAEGVTIEAPDGSLYWRSYRAKIIGAIR